MLKTSHELLNAIEFTYLKVSEILHSGSPRKEKEIKYRDEKEKVKFYSNLLTGKKVLLSPGYNLKCTPNSKVIIFFDNFNENYISCKYVPFA